MTFADMAPLMLRLRTILDAHSERAVPHHSGELDTDRFARQTGFAPRGTRRAEVVLASDVAVELGHPSTASRSMVLLTTRRDLVEPGLITRVGPDIDRLPSGERRPFGQVVMLQLRSGAAPDPFDLDTCQYLTNRLPGYMVRALPGRLWARVSKRARASGFDLEALGKALIAAYSGDFEGVEAVEVAFFTSSAADVEALAPVAREAEILAGRHKKLVITSNGEVECSELSCNTCDEKPVCDDLRDIVVKRRRMQRSGSPGAGGGSSETRATMGKT